MNVSKYYILYLLLSFLTISCVKDDGIFEETPATSNMQESIAIVSVLQQLRITGMASEQDLCFRFVYPLNLGYNTGASIEVKDFSGFKEMVFNQTSGFNVSKVDFPFSVVIKATNQTVRISNEAQLNALVIDCGFSTVRQDILEFLGSCFTLQYPITIKNATNKQSTVSSDEQLRNFITDQGTTYQPNFAFPITLIALSNSNQVNAQSNFGLLKFLETCDEITNPTICPTADYEITEQSEFVYSITANTDSLLVFSYEWTRDGQLVPEWQNNPIVIITNAEPGTYEICLKIVGIDPDCKSEVLFCDNLVVPKPCIDLSYSLIGVSLVVSDPFSGPFTWFVDGIETDDGFDSEGGFNLLNRFADGVYEICVENTPEPDCNAISNYCEMFAVDYCYDLSFDFTSDTNTYTFNGTITSPSGNVTSPLIYEWYVDDVLIESDGPDFSSGDDQLVYTFPASGTYKVCMRTNRGEDARCFMEEFCETITIP